MKFGDRNIHIDDKRVITAGFESATMLFLVSDVFSTMIYHMS